MKKHLRLLLCLALIFVLAGYVKGCGDKGGSSSRPGSSQPGSVSSVLEQGMAEADGKTGGSTAGTEDGAAPKAQAAVPGTEYGQGSIDIDLTALSSTMVYSEVYSMMSAPEEYIGKTVKMRGPFAYYYDEATQSEYFACIIQDATACCAQGIEFVLAGDYTFPDDYPEIDTEICVVGVFDTYQDGDYTYCTLRKAILL